MARGSTTRLLGVGVAALFLCAAQTAYPIIATNTIDRHVTYRSGGASVRVSGPIGCARGERIAIRVTVIQAASDALASGRWQRRCTGQVQHWAVRARAHVGESFESGKARACAVATTRRASRLTDTRRWCQRVLVSPRF
jgi:hypothetical protein